MRFFFYKILVCVLLCFVFLFFGATAWSMTATDYIKQKGYNFSPAVLDLLKKLGDLSSAEMQFIDKLSLLDKKDQLKYAMKFAWDGQITIDELKKVPEVLRLPDDPVEILQLLVIHVKKDVWANLYRGNERIIIKELKKWKKNPNKYFDDPKLCVKMIDAFIKKALQDLEKKQQEKEKRKENK